MPQCRAQRLETAISNLADFSMLRWNADNDTVAVHRVSPIGSDESPESTPEPRTIQPRPLRFRMTDFQSFDQFHFGL
jgi:hypothetical protein